MNFYYEKYLKYKNKYLKIKDQVGGMKEATVTINGENVTLSFPNHFFCPISNTLLVDPVILLEDGYSYERNHIQEWLANKGTSPITLEKISNKTLTPNDQLKAEIEKFKLDGYQRLKKQTHVPQPLQSNGARAVGRDDDFSVVSASDDFTVVSRNPEPADLQIGKIPLPWKKPAALPFTHGSSQERKEYYAARVRENDAYKISPALRIYEDLFEKTNSSSSTPLGGTSTAELYASVPTTDPDAVTKYLAVILYCYQILQWGATRYTSQYNSLGELPIDAQVKQEHNQRLRVAAQLASLKLDSLRVSYSDYFAPKTVALMRGLFR